MSREILPVSLSGFVTGLSAYCLVTNCQSRLAQYDQPNIYSHPAERAPDCPWLQEPTGRSAGGASRRGGQVPRIRLPPALPNHTQVPGIRLPSSHPPPQAKHSPTSAYCNQNWKYLLEVKNAFLPGSTPRRNHHKQILDPNTMQPCRSRLRQVTGAP
jgi:hypothetical protein